MLGSKYASLMCSSAPTDEVLGLVQLSSSSCFHLLVDKIGLLVSNVSTGLSKIESGFTLLLSSILLQPSGACLNTSSLPFLDPCYLI